MPLSRFVVYFCSLMTVCVVGATRLTPPVAPDPSQEQTGDIREDANGVISYEDAVLLHASRKDWAVHASAKRVRPLPTAAS